MALDAATKQTNKPGEANGRLLDVCIKAENGAQNLRMTSCVRKLRLSIPHLQPDWAHRCHIYTGTGLAATTAASSPVLASALDIWCR